MKQLDLLLPFALPHPDLAADLLKAMQAPALAKLLARARPLASESFDDYARALPHEHWIARRFGLPHQAGRDDSPAAALPALRQCGIDAADGHWFLLHPVHIHVAHDHLVLTGIGDLGLTEIESRLLFEEAAPLFAEAGLELRYGDPHLWFLRADAWQDLHTATPAAAGGHNIDIWMPRGDGERAWRRVQNEVQMAWHAHAVNAARETDGRRTVNSLWLWGGAPAGRTLPPAPYARAAGLAGWMALLGRTCPAFDAVADVDGMATAGGGALLAAGDDLVEPAFAGDWGSWLAAWQQVEARLVAPALAALERGKIDHLRLVLTHNTGLKEFSVTRMGLRKFWQSPSLRRLAP